MLKHRWDTILQLCSNLDSKYLDWTVVVKNNGIFHILAERVDCFVEIVIVHTIDGYIFVREEILS